MKPLGVTIKMKATEQFYLSCGTVYCGVQRGPKRERNP